MLKFSEIVGHEQIKDHLQTAVRESKPFHAYIFQGETGVGKENICLLYTSPSPRDRG